MPAPMSANALMLASRLLWLPRISQMPHPISRRIKPNTTPPTATHTENIRSFFLFFSLSIQGKRIGCSRLYLAQTGGYDRDEVTKTRVLLAGMVAGVG